MDPGLAADLQRAVSIGEQARASTATVPPARPVAAERWEPPSAEEPGELRSDLGEVFVSSSRDWWDDEHTIARLPNGTHAVLVDRAEITDIPGMAPYLFRCKIRVAGAHRLTGWVMCADFVN